MRAVLGLLLRLLRLFRRMLVTRVPVAATIATTPLVVLLRALLPVLRPASALRLRFARLLMQRIAGLEARNDALLDLAAHELFDIRHQWPVVETDQRNGFAR